MLHVSCCTFVLLLKTHKKARKIARRKLVRIRILTEKGLECDAPNQSRFLGRGCDEELFSEKKGVFSEKGGGNSVNQGFW